MDVSEKHAIIKLTPMITDVDGECPGCGFESLRRIRMYHVTSSGVGTLADRTICGRCINDIRETL